MSLFNTRVVTEGMYQHWILFRTFQIEALLRIYFVIKEKLVVLVCVAKTLLFNSILLRHKEQQINHNLTIYYCSRGKNDLGFKTSQLDTDKTYPQLSVVSQPGIATN